MADKKDGARSYRGSVIGDSMNLTINIKRLIQIFVLVGMLVYGWYQLETRIQDLERNMVLALEEIAYMKACEISRYCDNLPPLKEKFIKHD